MRPAALALLLAGCQARRIAVSEDEDAGDDSAADGGGGTGSGGGDDAGGTAGCGLEVDLSTPYWWEGETVTFVARCRTGVSAAAGDVAVLGAPAGARFDAATGVFAWDTGATDGGRVDLAVTAASATGFPESETVTLWVADNPDLPFAAAPDPDTYLEEWGLPVVHIEPSGALSQEAVPARITIRGAAIEGSAKIRGAFSAGYTKPSYTLDFEGEELAVDEWDGPSRGHLILITSFDDISYVRQKLIYDLWIAMAEHQDVERLTPRTFFAVVYIDGAYQGLYTGCDRIDDEFIRHMGFASGEGNLYKAVNHDANFKLVMANGGTKTNLHAGYTKEEGLPEDDFSDLDALVAEVGGASLHEIASGQAGAIDLDEFMDWFILVSYALAEDSAGKNSYLYSGEDTPVFRFVPWDFNHAFGQDWRTLRTDPEADNDYVWNNRVFEALQEDPAAAAALWARMAALRDDGPLNDAWLLERMDGYYDVLGPAPARDWDHWGRAHEEFHGWAGYRDQAGDWQDHAGEVAYMRAWIEDRDAWWGARLP